ncbi:putative glycolipid-binding domain-containing protein [Streptomyces bambusae]|uniref:Glycolipid-binding domain-containing protein n=1 Tax=Streptomyces bambusae TaxID=1550616 RepID=A0ABS6ZEQ2_9ACTN|nr:putative glycolipid-binding domain-containing protein [Streptomyces bambusae]MBW5486239.1 hypothetical protein [Streptomyces bambusae]
MTELRVLSWEVMASRGFETAWVELGGGAAGGAPRGGLRARGRAVGTEPAPYWISYTLETDEDFVTRRLHVTAEDADGARELDLRRSGSGSGSGSEGGADLAGGAARWTADGEPLPGLDAALDCDLGLCPLTNTMPVLRHGLLDRPGERQLLMAWVAVPELTVHPSRQTYTHLGRTGGGGARVRYASGDFVSDIEFDADGLVVDYPELAHRLT